MGRHEMTEEQRKALLRQLKMQDEVLQRRLSRCIGTKEGDELADAILALHRRIEDLGGEWR